ncbi:MAG: hypothetical protein H0V66_14465, partial [Bdellovibrionales bacterium]|nr:hypothetical protein [Bdellovibrionales bacterium]
MATTKIGTDFRPGVELSKQDSLLTVSNSQVLPGGTINVSLSLKDSNGNPFVSSTVVILFFSSGGTSTGTLSSVINNGNGTYLTTFTGGLAGTALTLSAKVDNEILVSTALVTVTGSPLTYAWPFDFGTTANYTPSTNNWLTSTLSFSGGVCQLTPTDQVDDDDGAFTGFDGGTFSGVSSFSTLVGEPASSGLKLGNNGGCNGTITNCVEFASNGIPEWSSLIAYWKMNANWNDAKGSSNGVAVGNVTFTPSSRIGSHAGTFDGNGDYINLDSSSANVTGLNQGTITGWFKADSVGRFSYILGLSK